MGFLDRFKSLADAPRPKTITPRAEGYGEKKLFGEVQRDFATVKGYADIYLKGGLVTEGIRCYALSVFSNGFRIEGDDEDLVALCEDFISDIDLDLTGPQAVTDALWAGDSFQEKARGAGERSDRIVALLPRPPETFKIVTDDYGLVRGYAQKKKDDLFGQEFIPLKKEEIFHFKIESIGGSPYGISLIQTAEDDIMRDCWIAEAITEGIKRHGSPKYHVRVGQEGESIPDNIMTMLDSQLQNIESKNEFITPKDVEISVIDVTGTPNAEQYSNFAVQRLCAAMGVPEEYLGLGRGSTEATAKIRERIFDKKVRAIQRRFSRSFSSQVLDDVTGIEGAAWLVFNEPSTIELDAKADVILKIKQADVLDPIISKEEAREMLGFDEVEETEDAEPIDGEEYLDET